MEAGQGDVVGNGTEDNVTFRAVINKVAADLTDAGLHAVVPKKDCPHMKEAKDVFDSKGADETLCGKDRSCADCEESSAYNNWICLSCYKILCGRDREAHMLKHHEETGHPICLSFDDASFWCYSCDSYVDVICDELKPIYRKFHQANFGEDVPPFLR